MAPIMSNYEINGYVVIHSDYHTITESCYSLQGAIFFCFGILFVLSFILLVFFVGFVYMPLKKITKATEQYANGNFHYELQPESNDEIGYLAGILSYMASEIARTEDDQKIRSQRKSRLPLPAHFYPGLPGSHTGRHHSAGAPRKISAYCFERNRTTDQAYQQPFAVE